MRPLTFAHCAGDVIYDARTALTQDQIDRLMRVYAQEAQIAALVGATAHFEAATTLQMELAVAASEQARWKACGDHSRHHMGRRAA